MKFGKIPAFALTLLLVCVCCVSVVASADYGQNNGGESQSEIDVTDYLNAIPRMKDGDSIGFTMKADNEDAYDFSKLIIKNFNSNELSTGGQLTQSFIGVDLISAFNDSESWDDYVSYLTEGGQLDLGVDADFTFNGKSVSDSRFEITMLGTADLRFALEFPLSSDYHTWSGFGEATPYDRFTMDETLYVKSVITVTNGVVTDILFDAYLDGSLGSSRNYLGSNYGDVVTFSDEIRYEQDISNTVSIRASQTGIGSVSDLNDALNGRGNGMNLALDIFLAHSYEGLATDWSTAKIIDTWENVSETHSVWQENISAEDIAAYVAMVTADSSSRDPQLTEQFMMFFMTLDYAKMFISNPGYTSASEILSGFGYYLSEDTYFRFFDVLNAIKDQAFEFNKKTATSDRNAILEGYAVLGKLKLHESLKDSISAKVSGVEAALNGMDTPDLEGNYSLSYDKREDGITELRFLYEAPLSAFTLDSKIGGTPVMDIRYQECMGGASAKFMTYSEYCLLSDKPRYIEEIILDGYQPDIVIDSNVGMLRTTMSDSERTNLHSVTVHGHVEVIASGAFYNCTNLEVVSMESVGTIENNAFYGCLTLRGIIENKSPYHIAEEIRNGYSGPYGAPFAQAYTDNTVGSTTAVLTSTTGTYTSRITVTSYETTYYGSSASSTYYNKANGYYGHANPIYGSGFPNSVGYYEVQGEYVHIAFLAYVDNILIEASVYAPVSSFTAGDYQVNGFVTALYAQYSNAVAPVVNNDRVLSFGSIGTIKNGAFNTLEKADRLLLLKSSENVEFDAFTRLMQDDIYNVNGVGFSVGKVAGKYVAYVHSFSSSNHPLTVEVPEEFDSSQTSMNVVEVDLFSGVSGNIILRAGVVYHFNNSDVYENGENGCTFVAEESSRYTVESSNGYSIVIFEGRAVAVADSRPNDYGLPENDTERVFVIPEGLTSYYCKVPRTMDRIITPDSLQRFVPNNSQSTFFHLEIGRNLAEINTSSIASASIRSTNDNFSIVSTDDFKSLVSGGRILAVWGNGTVYTVPAHVNSFNISSLSINETVQKVIIGDDVVDLRGYVTSGTIKEIVIGPNVASNSLKLTKEGLTVILSSENRALGNYVKDGMVYLNNRLVYVNELPANGIINADSTTTYVGYIPGATVYCLPIGAYPIIESSSESRVVVGTNIGYSYYSGRYVKINCDFLQSDINGITKRLNLTYETSYFGGVQKCNSLFEYRVLSYNSDTGEIVIEFTGSYPDLFGITCSTFGVEVETISPNSFRATLTAVPNSTQNLQVDLVPCTHKVTFDMGSKTYDVDQFSIFNMEFPEKTDNLASRSGLLFAGWYEDSEYTVPFNGVYNKDITRYYAKYVSYTDFFSIDANKGTAKVGAVNGMTTELPTVTPLEGYEFLGWSAMGMFISADSTDGMSVPYYDLLQKGQKCTAVFKKTQLPTYEVKYILNGEIYDSKTKTEGDIIYNAPLRDNDAFQYWSIDDNPAKMFNIVRGDMTFTAVIETFIVTWTDEDGTVLKTETVGKGTVPEYGTEVPTKKSTDAFEYEFAGWDPVVTAIDGDTVYKATYNEFPLYTVTWKNYDGTVLYSIKVRKDTVPEYNGELPLKDADVRYTYQFDKWSPAMEAVTSDTVYVATFKVATELDYTITWKNYDGTILQSSKVKYADMPAYAGNTPMKDSTDRFDYEFSGWSPAVAVVTGEAVYIAQFDEFALHYITWKNHDGTVLATSAALREGVSAEYTGTTPTKTAEHYDYVFKDWSKSEATNGDITCVATFTETPKDYDVVFITNGVEVGSKAPYGSQIVLPAEPPSEDGLVFVRWDGYEYGMTVSEVNKFTAVFMEGTIESENGKTTKTYDLDDGSNVTIIADENTGVVSTNTSKTVEGGDKTTVTKEEVVTDLSGKPLGSTETVTETVVNETAGSTLVNNQVTQKDASGNTTQTVTDTTLSRADSTTVSKEVVDANGNSTVTADSQVKAEAVSGTVKVEDSVIDNALSDLATVTANTSSNATKDITVTVKSNDTESASATTSVSKEALGKVSDAGAKLALEAGVGNVTIDANVAKNLSEKQIDGEVSLNIRMADKSTMTSQQRNVVGNATVIELTAKVGNESVHQLGGVATITVPYALKYWENPDNIKVWYITDDGHYYLADSVVYSNLNGGTVTFTTTHFSMYAISTEANLGSAHGDFVETIPFVCVSLIAVACIIAAAFAVASAARKRD